MKVVLGLLLLAAVVLADDKYTTKYDNVDLDELLQNERLYKKYFACFENTGPCTPDAKDLKDVVPDALQTECTKCSEKQKVGVEKVLRFVLENNPDDFKTIEKLYDPSQTYRKKYEEVAAKKGIKLPD